MPQASPNSKISQQVGLTTIHLNYSRPGKKNRKIFGELVPFGSVWRTGANNPTTLEFDIDLKVNGLPLRAGKYAMYTIPEKKSWTIIFSNNTELWGAMGYDPADDALRINVPVNKLKKTVETMKISFSKLTDSGAQLNIAWDKTSVGFQIEMEVDEVVMRQIKELLIDRESNDPGLLFQAANYYYKQEKDLNKALAWVTKSVEIDPKYYTLHLKAKILAALGRKKEAVSTAQVSMKLAEEAGNPDYVALNQRLIDTL
jgi:tetratricopeptide (TPR) repeat protein